MFLENITKEKINELRLIHFGGDIFVIDKPEDVRLVVRRLSCQAELGFDTETKPTFVRGEYNPMALIQLSTIDKAYLFRLNKIGYPKELFDLLENPGVTKYGISIDDDIKNLKKCRSYRPASFIDVNSIAKDLEIQHTGVKKLAAIFLNRRISKNQQTTNWENETLTLAQQKYAATDAWICLKIVTTLRSKGHID